MEWIFDASVAMAWCFEDEKTERTDALLDRLIANSPAGVPHIWPLEIANVLTLAVRRRRISQNKRHQFLSMLLQSPITVDSVAITSVFNTVIPLCDKYGLTSYDASYLELAMRLGLPLATLDKNLRAAAMSAGVDVI